MSITTVLNSLRAGLHTLFALLLVFGVVRAHGDGTLTPLAGCIAAILAGFYALGAVRGLPTQRAAWWWLAGITMLWLGLMVHGQDFMWLEFPLVFLFLRHLPRVPGLIAVVALWAVAAFVPAWRYPDSWSLPFAIGPAIGTAMAVAVFYGYAALRAEANRFRALAEELQRTQESLARSERLAGALQERERLSREIHDTVAQGLSSIVLLSRAAQGATDPSGHLATIQDSAQDALGQARRLVKELATDAVPAPAASSATFAQVQAQLAALVAAQRDRAQALGESTEFRLVADGNDTATLPAHIAAALERATREGLSNAARHACARTVVVSLSLFPGEVTLDVADDGIGGVGAGAPTRLQNDASGFGLAGLRARVAEAGGTLTVDSAPGAGTTLTVAFDLPTQPAQQSKEV